jgi:DNA-binding MarR family transcriptional regulator
MSNVSVLTSSLTKSKIFICCEISAEVNTFEDFYMSPEDGLFSKQKLLGEVVEIIERVISSGVHAVSSEWFTLDLSMPQVRVMFLLLQEGALRMGDMATSLGVSMPRATALIDKLVDRELVVRWTGQGDRRSVLCRLTKQGEELGSRLLAERKSRWEERLMNLTPSELRRVYQAMELIVYRSRKPVDESQLVGVEAMRN